MQQSTMMHKRSGLLSAGSRAAARPLVVRCSAQRINSSGSEHREPSRRESLLLGAAALAAPLLLAGTPPASAEVKDLPFKLLPVNQLGSAQKKEQREEFVARAQKSILKYLDATDAPQCVRLALLDAGTYDAATQTGGFNGSAAARPPADVKGVVEKLRKAKAEIDSEDTKGAGPISWADLIYLAGKTTIQASWKAAKVAKAGEQAVAQTGNEWPVVIGREDADDGEPSKVPKVDASVEEITAYLKTLGAKPGAYDGPFAGKPPFWEKPGFLLWTASAQDPAAEEARFAAQNSTYADIKRSYDISRRTISRTDYETDFGLYFNKLASLGANINPKKYLYPQPILAPKL